MRLKNPFVIILIVLFGLNSCHTVDEKIFEEDDIPQPTTVIRTNLRGIVKDVEGKAIEGALVKIGSESQTTNLYGYFNFDDILIIKSGNVLKIEKNGFLSASKLVIPQFNDNFYHIRMIDEFTSTSFVSTSGASVSLNDGASITFEANSIVDENGDQYNGNVLVDGYYLSPTAPFMADLMPGNLSGIKTNDNPTVLATLGMVYANLKNASGQSLFIKEGSTAMIKIPIPSAYQGTAPSSMPMWSYDEQSGYWQEEQPANLTGEFYEANVNHFSWWNADWPYNPIALSGKLVYDNEALARSAISNVAIRISLLDRPWNTSTVYTNANGEFNAVIPQSNSVSLEILNDCGEIAYSFEVGPFGSDTDLGEVVIDYSTLTLMEISGTLVNCDFEPILNGYAIINFSNSYTIAAVDDNGNFNASIPRCNTLDSIEIRGFDAANLIESSTFTFPSNVNQMNVGELNVCEDFSDGIIVVYVDGTRIVHKIPASASVSFSNFITNSNLKLLLLDHHSITSNTMEGQIEFTHLGVGEYQNIELTIESALIVRGDLIYNLTGTVDPLVISNATIHEIGENRNKFEFNANWIDQNGDSHDIYGYARN